MCIYCPAACLLCLLKPDVTCTGCSKPFCGDCWRKKSGRYINRTLENIGGGRLCDHNHPYHPLNGWRYY